MVRNPEYLGKTVYGKSRKVSCKSKKIVSVPEEQRIVTDGTHEPLVSQAVWNLANDIANRHRKSDKTGEIHIFSGLLFCKDCGASIALSKTAFICQRYRAYSKDGENGCTSHRIPYKLLYASVLGSVQEVTEEARRDREGPIARLSGASQKKQQAALYAAKQDRAKAEKRLAKIGELIRKAFEESICQGGISPKR